MCLSNHLRPAPCDVQGIFFTLKKTISFTVKGNLLWILEKIHQKSFAHTLKNSSKPAIVVDAYPSIILLLNIFMSSILF